MGQRIDRAIEFVINGIPRTDVRVNCTQISRGGELKGKKILITGGGRGIGYHIAQKCVSEGGEVLISGRNADTLRVAAERLSGISYIPFDVTDFVAIPDFVAQSCERLGGRIDILVNNAGVSHHEGTIEKVSFEDFDTQFNTNLKAPYFLSKEFLRLYKKNKGESGNILFISSERGFFGDDLPYGLTKAALNSLIKGLSARLIPVGIRVNGVAPGVTASDLTGYDRDGNLYDDHVVAKRILLPEEVAEIVVFMLSDAASSLSGVILPCDLGNHLRTML